MARGRKRKTEKGSFTDDQMRNAVKAVLTQNQTLRTAANNFGLKFQTLAKYVKKQREAGPDVQLRMTPNYACRRVFTNEQEQALKDYILKCSKMCYGQSTFSVRTLAYEMAKINNIQVPETWNNKKQAGLEWLHGFFKRNPDISVRRPENCSLSRMTSFNAMNVKTFFDNLRDILKRYPEKFSDGTRIFNLDETCTTTVQRSSKVVAPKGAKQVSRATSGERGILVTTCATISASGNHLPPVMVFPRKKFNVKMTQGAPPGTLGLVSKLGWMTSEVFPDVMKHFIKYSNSSKENPSLLIFDNHESHMSIEAINIAKANGVTILTLPPHCSNKLQPLDVSVFSPFKTYYYTEIENWMIRHPGQTITIYDIAACVSVGFDRAMKPETIKSGFRHCGIFPFDDQVYTDEDFLSSFVTDRPLNNDDQTNNDDQENNEDQTENQDEQENIETEYKTPPRAEQSGSSKINIISQVIVMPPPPKKKAFISPEIFKGFPKAGPRKDIGHKRKRGRSFVPTDTPEKTVLEERQKCKTTKTKIKMATKKVFNKTERKVEKKTVSSESESDDTTNVIYDDSSSEDDFTEDEITLFKGDFDYRELKSGDFALIRFGAHKKEFFYVGKIISVEEEEEDCEISFLRRSSRMRNKFYFPELEDIAMIQKSDVAQILPKPRLSGTKRQQNFLHFDVNFGQLDVR